MLLKLMKYDFRQQFKEHIGLYALVFVSALTEIILESFKFDLVSVFFVVLYSLSVIAMLICSFVIIVLYFRRNLLRDEGYLMNTLPVEPWMLYVSKFLTAFVLFILDLIVAILSFSIINQSFAWIGDIIKSMSDEVANAGFTRQEAQKAQMPYMDVAVGYHVRHDIAETELEAIQSADKNMYIDKKKRKLAVWK